MYWVDTYQGDALCSRRPVLDRNAHGATGTSPPATRATRASRQMARMSAFLVRTQPSWARNATILIRMRLARVRIGPGWVLAEAFLVRIVPIGVRIGGKRTRIPRNVEQPPYRRAWAVKAALGKTEMPNDFSNQGNTTLIHVAQTLVEVAGKNPNYGLDKAATDLIASEATGLQSLGFQWAQQEAILRGLTEQKAAARAALVAKLGTTAKGLEANLAVTDAMLRAAALFAPTGLTAEGYSDGTLALSWTPQNRTRVSYVVEVSPDGQNWSYRATTQRRTLKAPGFAPGQAVYVRVFAVNSTLGSPASNVASVYAPVAPAAVRLKVA